MPVGGVSKTQADASKVQRALRVWGTVVDGLTGEWMLTRKGMPNGGSIIAARSAFGGTLVYLGALTLRCLIDPGPPCGVSNFQAHIVETLPWLGAIWAGFYTALYTRYSSQWSYLADLYNQIKSTECQTIDNKDALAQWKAGFIEDAENLHLVTKSVFASVVKAWLQDDPVRASYIADVENGTQRFEDLRNRLGIPSTFPQPPAEEDV
jgi:hypothetical protein